LIFIIFLTLIYAPSTRPLLASRGSTWRTGARQFHRSPRLHRSLSNGHPAPCRARQRIAPPSRPAQQAPVSRGDL